MAKKNEQPAGGTSGTTNATQGEGKPPEAVATVSGAVPAAVTQTTVSAPVESPEAPAEKPVPKSHTHRVNWTLLRDRKRHSEGDTLALSDEEAAQLGDVVTKL